jgi:hypothetical protein
MVLRALTITDDPSQITAQLRSKLVGRVLGRVLGPVHPLGGIEPGFDALGEFGLFESPA